MNKTLRTAIFIFFVLIFFISAPLAVLYTAGYRYDSEFGFISKTGVLSVTTSPRGASILLNDDEVSGTSPKILKRLSPGEYSIELIREGYHSWKNTIKINGGFTTYIQDIALFKISAPTFLIEQNISEVTINNDSSIAAYIVNKSEQQELWFYEASSKTHTYISKIEPEIGNVSISWSINGSYLLVFSDKKLDVYDESGKLVQLLSSKLTEVKEAYWHPSEDRLLVMITEENIIYFDVVKNSTLVIDSSSTSVTPVDASILYFIDNGTQTELRQTISGQQKLIAILYRGTYQIVFRNGNYIIAQDDIKNMYLIDIHSSEPLLLQVKAHLFDWNDEAGELVYSDGYEFNVYSPERHETQFIARQSSEITEIKWDAGGDAIIFSTKDCLCAIDRNLYGNTRQKTTLIENGSFEDFWISKNGKQAYIFGTVEQKTGLFQLELK
ncbi:PEGA domain-containing protein [Patescibacteria group bacterium]|nr:PEGA domain-containing protein [Patescibacteria group bacterium]